MRPRWTRSDPAARTDRLTAVPAPRPPVRVPRTLRLRAVPSRRGLTDPRHAQVAAALQRALDRGYSCAAELMDLPWMREALRDGLDHVDPGRDVLVFNATVRDAQTGLSDAHRLARLHEQDQCARCSPTELCPWHYARLRSWWDARDRAAVALTTALDAMLAGQGGR